MRALATVLWHFPFFGFLTAIYTLVAGAMFVATGVGAPIGTGLFELGKFLFAPFGHRMVDASLLQTELSRNTAWRVWGWILMVIWLPFGLLAAFFLILQVFFCCITIIGIPAGVAAARSIGPMLNPVGKKVITADLYNEIMRRKASARADALLGSQAPPLTPNAMGDSKGASPAASERLVVEKPNPTGLAFASSSVTAETPSASSVGELAQLLKTKLRALPRAAIAIGAIVCAIAVAGGVAQLMMGGSSSSTSPPLVDNPDGGIEIARATAPVTEILPRVSVTGPDSTPTDALTKPNSAIGTKDIVDTAAAAGQFTQFVALVQSGPNTERMLRRNGSKTTVLVPTNEAFSALPEGLIDDLLKPENQRKLGIFIGRHILTFDSGVEYWGQDRKFELKTLQGGTLNAIRRADGTVMINNATLSQHILATNGVIVGIDRVLMPPADFEMGNPEPTTSSSGLGQTQTHVVDNVEAYSPVRAVLSAGNGVRIREQPSTAAKVLWFLGRDSALDVIGKSRQGDGVWFQIRYATLDAQMQPVTRLGFVRSDLTNSKQE